MLRAVPGGWARSCCGEGAEAPPGACEGLLPGLRVEQGPAELTWGRDSSASLPLGMERGQGKQQREFRGEQSHDREMEGNSVNYCSKPLQLDVFEPLGR